ncbi:MAG: transglycosylase domain-containing protein [Acutalibacter sp.]|nr:transglycosylase domain-containing protein [Acutalibacter sp.]
MKRALRFLRNIFLVVLAVGLCAAGAVAFQGYKLYTSALEEMPLYKRVEQVRQQPDFTSLESLPATYRDAVVAAEDHRFYSHGGIDLLAIGRAVWNDLRSLSFAEGGSTITQQLAKNMLFTQEKDLCRKAAEVFAAWDLESHYSKDEILELYVNSIYFGSGCYSVGAASQTYFEKDPAQMDANECTLLAGIPNAPAVYDLSVNPELAVQRQRQVVSSMLEHEFLTQEEAEELLAS